MYLLPMVASFGKCSFCYEMQEDKDLKLKKALYGLKQTPKEWNSRLDKVFQVNGFIRCPHDRALYQKVNINGDILIVLLVCGWSNFSDNNSRLFDEFKRITVKEFEKNDIELMAYYLGIKLKQEKEGNFYLSRRLY